MGWPFFFSLSPTSRSSSSVRGQVIWPTSSNQDLRYAIWAPRMPSRPAAPATSPVRRRKVRRSTPVFRSGRGRSIPALLAVDLAQFLRGPLHGVLGLHALGGLGVHVGDDVLGEGLRGPGGR